MKTKLIICVLLLITYHLSLVTCLSAADTVKIGCVDFHKVFEQSEEGKKVRSNLESLKEMKQRELEKMVAASKKIEDELNKQATILSNEAKKAKMDELEKMDREIKRFVSDSEAELQRKQREIEISFLNDLVDIVQKIGQEEGYTLILPISTILYSNKGMDITEMVIKKYNESKATRKKQ